MSAETDVRLLEENKVKCSWPDLYYDKIQLLLGMLDPKVFVEVGVAYGYHAEHFLTNNLEARYVGIDPFLPSYDKKDPFSADVGRLFDESDPLSSMSRLHGAVSLALGKFGDRASILQKSSLEASIEFKDDSVDAVFVDANHKYRHVLEDLRAWFPKLRQGGLLIGDDYDWPEVKRAAIEFSESIELGVWLIGSPANDHITFVIEKREPGVSESMK